MEKTNVNRTRIIGLRLTLQKYELLEKRCKNSTANKISDYVRTLLLEKPVTVNHCNKSLDDLMAELTVLRTELNSIGNNFNQAVKKLHMLQQINEFKGWIMYFDSEEKKLLNKVGEIKNCINKIAEKWLQ